MADAQIAGEALSEEQALVGKRVRADAQRNLLAVLQAAKEVFAASGVDAPVRDIAERAGVGVGTLYRHYPTRADLIAAVFRQEMDACADEADALSASLPPFEALATWMRRFVDLAGTKQGLAKALHSGDPAFDALPARREERLMPAFRHLFENAATSGAIRDDIGSDEFVRAAASLCVSVSDTEQAQRLVGLLVDGLRNPVDGRQPKASA
ncbi:helix-turn-helix domain-containing protein [Acidiphilium acidophilum]|uniref:TetR/AcrR family transcriptional regulator n=1 Tax=Acidiphilium acidophilum TaxID=76588 RepID=UPI002E8E7992|nr:helix-turn-helix domain-containing protein [Acidiphilium acidophilum]